MAAPFRGFMRDPSGNPVVALRKTMNISISLEASGELAPGGQWASDTGDPIVGYYLSPYPDPMLQIARAGPGGSVAVSWASGAVGMRLQTAPSLVNPNWHDVSGSDTTNRMTLPGMGATRRRAPWAARPRARPPPGPVRAAVPAPR